MGLDAYVETRIPLNNGNMIKGEELWYGRKEWHIQKWMADQYFSAHPDSGEGFNCQDLYLDIDMLHRFKADFISGTLLGAANHFNGIGEYEQNAVLNLITAAEPALLSGQTVIYTAWY